MPLLQKEFDEMMEASFDAPVSAVQRAEMRAAFFAGVVVALDNQDDELMIQAELEDYVQEIQARARGTRPGRYN